jgi:hypothetical protein
MWKVIRFFLFDTSCFSLYSNIMAATSLPKAVKPTLESKESLVVGCFTVLSVKCLEETLSLRWTRCLNERQIHSLHPIISPQNKQHFRIRYEDSTYYSYIQCCLYWPCILHFRQIYKLVLQNPIRSQMSQLKSVSSCTFVLELWRFNV